jgi:phage terminase large subunit GpA-like protein
VRLSNPPRTGDRRLDVGRHKLHKPEYLPEHWSEDTRGRFPDAGRWSGRWVEVAEALRPPPPLSLLDWAEKHMVLSPESSAVPGRFRALPYQRGILAAMADPTTPQVTLMKSARVGYTTLVSALIGYHMHHDPAPQLVVQPTLDDARGFSREVLTPLLRDVPVLAEIQASEMETDTTLARSFPGGVITLVGATSGAGLRRISRRVILLDEVDGYPSSAGADGDPVRLAIRRSDYFHDRRIVAGSTPLTQGVSRIEALYEAGDRRRYYVPCPQCGHTDHLVFSEREGGGHWLQFDPEDPRDAHFVCSKNGCVIEHKHKRDMLERGEWRAETECQGHASFHIWAAYSLSPNATWADIAREFVAAKRAGREMLKTFVNTWLGETWVEAGEAPDWELIYARREAYQLGTVPSAVEVVTCGVDVQHNRWVYEVVGWAADKQSWCLDAGVIPGTPSDEGSWAAIDALLDRTYPTTDGRTVGIRMLAVDAGDQTQHVYGWVRRHDRSRVVAVHGTPGRTLIGTPKAVDVRANGKRIARGVMSWPVGSGVAKSELYGWLRLPTPAEGSPCPPGWCHFSDALPQEYFRQLTSEQLVSVQKRTGHSVLEWRVQAGRENHYLDARVYARAAAAILGLDRMARPPLPVETPAPKPAAVVEPVRHLVPVASAPEQVAPPPPTRALPPSPARAPAKPPGGRWIGPRRGGWIR